MYCTEGPGTRLIFAIKCAHITGGTSEQETLFTEKMNSVRPSLCISSQVLTLGANKETHMSRLNLSMFFPRCTSTRSLYEEIKEMKLSHVWT